ncbi:TIGR03749 family integrating conjugative element protein [Vibrio sp. 1180_3]|uniref:TIGR03749 family integrating conjugative element protein n=1 Tax=Vibrio sp. 1180_3 TaxID=2528832 RepID=UPI0024060CDD|nr:TIGR03749 family integrating conjugative element protein [Vibrio sp. 1180_3]MDF9399127.1 TIGR03749 family integrating conjugative element protein [Vibrio sp. 1180_3]
MKILIHKICLLFALSILATSSFATEMLVWDKRPLKIRLEVNKEKIIEFPDNISLGIPEKLHSRLRLSAAAGVLYITPIAQFPATRIKVRLEETNELVYIDLFAVETKDEAPSEMVRIITKEAEKSKDELQQARLAQSSTVTIKELIQYASHDFYAPPRLKNLTKPVVESLIKKQLRLDILFMGRSASLFDLKPIKQYRTSKYTLTAILITNRTSDNQKIIHRDIYPNFIAASSQHLDVGPKGSDAQSTILYLVTEKPMTDDGVYAI